ncbi:MAG: hypothetical protein M1822_004857 [Bathelium mastoideum]|nr:MAG: hypothetical protein M1822_004857 [Bathelium mastoideum]
MGIFQKAIHTFRSIRRLVNIKLPHQPVTIAEISRKDLEYISTPASASITDVRYLSSYNWIESSKYKPTIAIPGCPNLWFPPDGPQKLKKCPRYPNVAQNAARRADNPLEPLFRALYFWHPSFDIRTTDIVTDRSSVCKLLKIVNPRLWRDGSQPFSIGAEVVKNTTILLRHKTEPREYICWSWMSPPSSCHNNIKPDRDSVAHHRIISYRLGELQFILRHETDGYIDGIGTKRQTSKDEMPKVDNLSSILGPLTLSPQHSRPSEINHTGSELEIREEGRIVPLDSIVEIKTYSKHNGLRLERVLLQLWVSQTLKLVRACHNDGEFKFPKIQDMTVQVKEWEDRKQTDIRLLVGLIKKIRDVVKVAGGRAMVRYDVDMDKLIFHKIDGKGLLPEDLYLKWEIK